MPFIQLNKPFQVLCQFRDSDGRSTLADFVEVPGIYPAGRLDFDSEGLTLLTDDGQLQARISNPRHKLEKHYWVQVEGQADETHLNSLLGGVSLKDGPAVALSASIIVEPPLLWERHPPIRQRKTIPTSWLDIVINEGRNRQIRRMTAAAGLPALRLVRHRIGPWSLDGLDCGETRQVPIEIAWQALRAHR